MASKRYPWFAFFSIFASLCGLVTLTELQTVNVFDPFILFFYACVKLLMCNTEVEKQILDFL